MGNVSKEVETMNQKEILKTKNRNGDEECLQWAHLLGTVRKEVVNLKETQ